MARPARGVTLVELAIVLAVAAVLLSVAWPAWTAQRLRAGRQDGISALQRVHAAQEVYRAQQGHYADRLGLLRGARASNSDAGLYVIALVDVAPGRFIATARAQGAQARDGECAVLMLRIEGEIVHHEPSRSCWQL